MTAPERLLRAVFLPGQVYQVDGEITFSKPYVAEIVSINGVERVRGYYISSTRTRTPFFFSRSCRLRAVTVYEWHRLTDERLASDLVPVSTERRGTA